MTQITWWSLILGALIVLELLTGTFYLLMLGLGAGAALVAALLGWDFQTQLVCAALVGASAVLVWHRRRQLEPKTADAANTDLHIDLGQIVEVEHWGADGHATVRYRGAAWQARHVGDGPAQAGPHTICGVEGSRLLLKR